MQLVPPTLQIGQRCGWWIQSATNLFQQFFVVRAASPAYYTNRAAVLMVDSECNKFVSTNMHRMVYGNAPLYIRDDISIVQERHSYNIRNSVLSFVLPRVNNPGDKSYSYIAVKLKEENIIYS